MYINVEVIFCYHLTQDHIPPPFLFDTLHTIPISIIDCMSAASFCTLIYAITHTHATNVGYWRWHAGLNQVQSKAELSLQLKSPCDQRLTPSEPGCLLSSANLDSRLSGHKTATPSCLFLDINAYIPTHQLKKKSRVVKR